MQPTTSCFDLNVCGAFRHAPSCANQHIMDLVITLIRKDAAHHHLFFNDEKFHNHLVHQLLADYSLGADSHRLEKTYQANAISQRARKPLKAGFAWDNLNCLGNEDYYSNYVSFFLEEIQNRGSKRCIEYYIFEQASRIGFYARFLSGVYHPLIHLGYGIEFNYPLMLAEGLAWIAVHQPRSQHFYEFVNKKNIDSQQLLKKNVVSTALDIMLSLHQNFRIDGVIKRDDEDKYTTVINTIPDVIYDYCQQWPVSESLEGPMGLRARATELQLLGAALCAGSYRPGQEIMLDFFLMHTLTSSLFLHSYIELLAPQYAAALLRGKFASDLVYYILRGRPYLNLEQFNSYSKRLSWDQIISKAIASDDEHVPKVVRALIHASHYDKNHVFSLQMYQAMASLAVEDNLDWNVDYPGFDQA